MEVKLTDIDGIAEKAISPRKKWPHMDVLCAKRDIDPASERVRVRPDICAIMCTEFAAELPGVGYPDDTIIVLYLSLPSGWRTIPGYFSQIGQ